MGGREKQVCEKVTAGEDIRPITETCFRWVASTDVDEMKVPRDEIYLWTNPTYVTAKCSLMSTCCLFINNVSLKSVRLAVC